MGVTEQMRLDWWEFWIDRMVRDECWEDVLMSKWRRLVVFQK
jgi:hypothetical protein